MPYSEHCHICPRMCGLDRKTTHGFCGVSDKIKAAKAMVHFGEEPCISGKNGSGAIFFSGCSLKCCFCQNFTISREAYGTEITEEHLCKIMLELENQNVNNINLVNPTHYTKQIINVLQKVKPQLHIPIIWNTGGYERLETIQMLDGLVDVYLPDLKYTNPILSKKYSGAENYFEYASKALPEMYRQVGKIKFNDEGLIKKGLIIRHLILPTCYHDSIDIIRWIAENFPTQDILVSVMRQYTPFGDAEKYPEINRKLSTFEYKKVIDECQKLGINGFSQDKGCDNLSMTPEFDLSGI